VIPVEPAGPSSPITAVAVAKGRIVAVLPSSEAVLRFEAASICAWTGTR